MTRNLNRRVEIACPVRDPKIRQMLMLILNTELADNVKASSLQADGSYYRKSSTLSHNDSQAYFMEHSLHEPEAPEASRDEADARRSGGAGLLCRLRSLLGGKGRRE